MPGRKRIVLSLVVVAALAAAVVVANEARRRKQLASAAASEIRAQLDELDPATRALVRAELASDVVKAARKDS